MCILETDDSRQAWIPPLAGAVRFREAIFSDQSWEVARRFFGGSGSRRVGHVHVVQPELLRVAHRPSGGYCHQTSSIFISLTHGCYRCQYFFLLLCANSSFDITIVKIFFFSLTQSCQGGSRRSSPSQRSRPLWLPSAPAFEKISLVSSKYNSNNALKKYTG